MTEVTQRKVRSIPIGTYIAIILHNSFTCITCSFVVYLLCDSDQGQWKQYGQLFCLKSTDRYSNRAVIQSKPFTTQNLSAGHLLIPVGTCNTKLWISALRIRSAMYKVVASLPDYVVATLQLPILERSSVSTGQLKCNSLRLPQLLLFRKVLHNFLCCLEA